MEAAVEQPDPFVEHTYARVVEAGPERAVVEQPPARALDNHLAVRHASALYAAAYEASRTLVLAAAAATGERVTIAPRRSELVYKAMPLGSIRSTATPAGPGWNTLAADLRGGAAVELATTVESTNEEGKAVVNVELSWRVEAS